MNKIDTIKAELFDIKMTIERLNQRLMSGLQELDMLIKQEQKQTKGEKTK